MYQEGGSGLSSLLITFTYFVYVKSENVLKLIGHCAKGSLLEVAQLSEQREADKVMRSYVKYKFIFPKIPNANLNHSIKLKPVIRYKNIFIQNATTSIQHRESLRFIPR
jgi:hypothetical protein